MKLSGFMYIAWHLGSWDNIEEMFLKIGAIRTTWLNMEDIGTEDIFTLLKYELQKKEIKNVKRFDIEELRTDVIAYSIKHT